VALLSTAAKICLFYHFQTLSIWREQLLMFNLALLGSHKESLALVQCVLHLNLGYPRRVFLARRLSASSSQTSKSGDLLLQAFLCLKLLIAYLIIFLVLVSMRNREHHQYVCVYIYIWLHDRLTRAPCMITP
jgi:hypothetical protein